MRRIIPTALMAVSLVTLTALGAAAQDDPAAVAITPAGLNADKVDGKSAVGHGASARKRAGKLVATNRRGQLPSNIVKPAWRLILGKPAAFMDGQIGWGEVQGMPPGFADGVDNKGVTGAAITTVTPLHGTSVLANGTAQSIATCPTGARVVGGGYLPGGGAGAKVLNVYNSTPDGTSAWQVYAFNPSGTAYSIKAYAMCLATDPVAVSAARSVSSASIKKGIASK